MFFFLHRSIFLAPGTRHPAPGSVFDILFIFALMIPRETIDEIKARADLLEVVGDYVDLKKSGSNYRGLSPFNQERTPSFYVVPSKGFFKDFSSGKAGDSITFLMEAEGMSYPEAIKHLAKKYGIEIAEEEQTDEQLLAQNERDSLFIVMKFANEYFQQQLWQHEEGQAIGLTYFKERGFGEETIREFGMGYSLDQWDGLLKDATAKGHNPELLEKAGLVVKKAGENGEQDRTYDRFRGRVMFPIYNISGRVVAFGARILGNKTEKSAGRHSAKYINSPETPIYHKSDVLYGLYQAKQAIRHEDTCYLVEGYTDVISLYQTGIKNVVASSGTSLTHEQIRLISRYTKHVTVLFDGDAAGLKASFRGIDMILEGGLNVKAVVLPEGEDPDSMARSMGAATLREYLTEHQEDFIAFKTAIFQKGATDDPIRQAELIREVIGSIAKVPDPIQRQVYIKTTSQRLNIDESLLIAELNKVHIQQQRAEARRAAFQEQDGPYETSENELSEIEGDLMPENPSEVQNYSSLYYQERELTRILILYGHLSVDENKQVCHYIYENLDGIDFQTEIYKKIAEIHSEKINEKGSLTEEYLATCGSNEISSEVINLVVDQHVIGNWKARNVIAPEKDENLIDVIVSNISRIKRVYLEEMLKQEIEKLKECKDMQEEASIMRKYLVIKKSQMEAAKHFGTVISPK